MSVSGRPIDLFTVKESIIINAPIEKLYFFSGDTSLDALWRSEVNIIHKSGEFKVGTRYTEDAKLGIHPNYITEVELVIMNPPFEAIYETVSTNPYFLKSYRLFKKTLDNNTLFVYKVEIEKGMIKDILGLNMPVKMVKYIYKSRMIKYLKNLKRYVERH